MRTLIPKLASFLLIGTSLCACTANQNDESRKDRAMSMMNERRYGETTAMLEESLREDPSNRSNAYLLAMSRIGQGNAEMFSVVSGVMSAQAEPPPALLGALDCNQDSWANLKDRSVACVLGRILNQVPEEHNLDVLAAQGILRQYFPNPRETSPNVNFLAAYVELYRFLNRSRVLLNEQNLREGQALARGDGAGGRISAANFERADSYFRQNVRELKGMNIELMHCFRRLKYSYGKMAAYTQSIDGKPLIEVGSHRLLFDENMSIERVLRFGIEVMQDEESNRPRTIASAETTEERLNRLTSGALNQLLPNLIGHLRHLGYAYGPAGMMDKIETSFKFRALLQKVLRGIVSNGQSSGENSEDQAAAVSNALWSHPPGVFGGLAQSLRQSWDEESIRATLEYNRQSEPVWRDLREIIELWKRVEQEYQNSADEDALKKVWRDRRAADPSFLALPTQLNSGSMHAWLNAVVVEMDALASSYLSGRIAGTEPMSVARRALVQEAWRRTHSWLRINVTGTFGT